MTWEVGNPIPNDWNEEANGWAVGLFLFPNSPRWGLVVRTVLRVLSRGRFWRRESGQITDAQDAGRLAYMSFTYVSFQELLDAINNLKNAVESQTLEVTVSNVCCDQLTAPSPPTPPPEDMPPSDIDDPLDLPSDYEGIPEYTNALCTYANALHWQVRSFLDFMTKLDTVAAVLTVIVALLGLIFPEPATTAIGGVTLVTIVTVLITVDGGLVAVATWAEDAIPFWEGKQSDFVCFVYRKMFTVDTWKEEVEDFVGDALDEVSATFPSPVIRTAVSWIEPFLSWMERDIYDRLETLEPHPSPVDCSLCDTCSCGDCHGDLISSCLPSDTIVPPASVTVTPGDLLTGEEYTLDWSYDPSTGILLIDATISGDTEGTNPGFDIVFTLPSNGLTKKRRMITIFKSQVPSPWSIDSCALTDGAEQAIAGSDGSGQRPCMETELINAGYTLPCGGVNANTSLSFTLSTPRPGAGSTHSVSLGMTVCFGMI